MKLKPLGTQESEYYRPHLGFLHLNHAVQVAYSANIKNEAEKERNRAARQMDTLMKVGDPQDKLICRCSTAAASYIGTLN